MLGRREIWPRLSVKPPAPWWQVAVVGGHSDALGQSGHPAQQSPGIEKARLVGMVLEGDEVEAEPLTELRQLDRTAGRGVGGTDECCETQGMTVVRHRCLLQSFVVSRDATSSPAACRQIRALTISSRGS